jgi:hypothetical protein
MCHSLDCLCRPAVVQIFLGAAMLSPAVAGGRSTVVAVLQPGVLLATVQRQCMPAVVTAFGKYASSM